jgi:hypothetical protein
VHHKDVAWKDLVFINTLVGDDAAIRPFDPLLADLSGEASVLAEWLNAAM